MADEQLVARVVRTLAEYVFPHDRPLVDRAVSAAVKAHWSGASASEACRVGQAFIARHDPAQIVSSTARRGASPLADQVA